MNKFIKGLMISGMVAATLLSAACGGDDKKADNGKPAQAAASKVSYENPSKLTVSPEVEAAFFKGAATMPDAQKWSLGSAMKSDAEVQQDMMKKGYFNYLFRAEGPDSRKEYKNSKGNKAYEVHTRTVIVRVCPHKIVSIKTESYNQGKADEKGKKDYATLLSEQDSKYSMGQKDGKRFCTHDGKRVELNAKL